jgi:hypothetical protein
VSGEGEAGAADFAALVAATWKQAPFGHLVVFLSADDCQSEHVVRLPKVTKVIFRAHGAVLSVGYVAWTLQRPQLQPAEGGVMRSSVSIGLILAFAALTLIFSETIAREGRVLLRLLALFSQHRRSRRAVFHDLRRLANDREARTRP